MEALQVHPYSSFRLAPYTNEQHLTGIRIPEKNRKIPSRCRSTGTQRASNSASSRRRLPICDSRMAPNPASFFRNKHTRQRLLAHWHQYDFPSRRTLSRLWEDWVRKDPPFIGQAEQSYLFHDGWLVYACHAALLGEADILSGQVLCPHSAPDSYSSLSEIDATEPWIMDGICAYVPQVITHFSIFIYVI